MFSILVIHRIFFRLWINLIHIFTFWLRYFWLIVIIATVVPFKNDILSEYNTILSILSDLRWLATTACLLFCVPTMTASVINGVLFPDFVELFNFFRILDAHISNKFLYTAGVLQPTLMIPDNVRMVKLGKQGHLLQQFSGLRIIVVNDDFLNRIYIRINPVPASVDRAEAAFSNHFEFFIVSLVPAPDVGVLGDTVLEALDHLLLPLGLSLSSVVLVEDLLQNTLIDLLVGRQFLMANAWVGLYLRWLDCWHWLFLNNGPLSTVEKLLWYRDAQVEHKWVIVVQCWVSHSAESVPMLLQDLR